ncbi:MAG: carboxypeptidase-like regulatory domain-containing protein, partial [Bacteroidota bacterium]|nr:carboxypeptidase-like regulatory domain-containing protein [Bacteroidota bacterium]
MIRKQLCKRYILAVIILAVFSHSSIAQVTTATLSGIVTDPKGAPLDGATVTVEFPEAGIKQSFVTKADGRFTVPNLRVGGPYKVTVDYVSYQQAVVENIFLDLGQNNSIEVPLKEKSQQLETVTIASGSAVFDNKRTGASTNISNKLIKALPTISRSADDYLRLTPSASATFNGLSFAGR